MKSFGEFPENKIGLGKHQLNQPHVRVLRPLATERWHGSDLLVSYNVCKLSEKHGGGSIHPPRGGDEKNSASKKMK